LQSLLLIALIDILIKVFTFTVYIYVVYIFLIIEKSINNFDICKIWKGKNLNIKVGKALNLQGKREYARQRVKKTVNNEV
jgi:hypothetical protein